MILSVNGYELQLSTSQILGINNFQLLVKEWETTSDCKRYDELTAILCEYCLHYTAFKGIDPKFISMPEKQEQQNIYNLDSMD